MEIEPKKAGQCWSCKYCKDIGTQTCEDCVTYVRQCSHPGRDVIDKCEHRCADYVWDGTHKEHWRPDPPAAPSSSAPSSTPAKGAYAASSDHGSKAAIAVIIAAAALICVILFLLFWPRQTAQTNLADIPASETTDPADYSLAGAIRYVSTQSGNGVNMRAKANASAEVVYAIPDNQSVVIQKTYDNWAYVSFDGYEGWCSMDYLITEEAHAQLMQNYLNIPAIVATESSALRLRMTPSLNSEPIESMPKGSEVIVLRLEGDWAYVDYRGMSGWCAAEYLEMQESPTEAP